MKTQIAANTIEHRNKDTFQPCFVQLVPDLKRLRMLTNADAGEVLEFLAKSPVHSVAMTSMICDNGIENVSNRGKFYGYRGDKNLLEAVALIGHTTLIESSTDESRAAFALAARDSETPVNLIMSDGKTIETFWQHFAFENQKPRRICTELLFELNFPVFVQNCDWQIRPAEQDQLLQIAEAHAEVAFIESGVDPLLRDREGFLRRCLGRIEKGKTFVVFENGKLVFKADIVAETAEVAYLEGIYVAPEFRGRNVGSSCLSQLGVKLLNRVANVCLLSNIEFKAAHKSFLKAGYKNTDCFQTIFV